MVDDEMAQMLNASMDTPFITKLVFLGIKCREAVVSIHCGELG
jgi:hypothetical protein